MDNKETLWELLGVLLRAHPWHGVSIGEHQPEMVTAYVELVPSDTVKYELDKETGLLKIDRPQFFSNSCPTLYGLIPQTFCNTRVAEYCMEKSGLTGIKGDNDPLDICIFSEKVIPRGDILLKARPIGGLRLLDEGEADDKIIAVMKDDLTYSSWYDISDCPPKLLNRLKHYFLTYKNPPGSDKPACEILDIYGKAEAYEVIRRANLDYHLNFAELVNLLDSAMRA